MNNSHQFWMKIVIIFSILVSAAITKAEIGVPVQLRVKSPTGFYPTESGVNFKLLVLSPPGGAGGNCILREENYSGRDITNGNISLNLGSGSRGSRDPNLTLQQVFDNSSAKASLFCVDGNNNIVSSEQSYTPTSSSHRVLRIVAEINHETLLVNFNMRAVPFAMQAESIGGKKSEDLLSRTAGTQLTQGNLNLLLQDSTRLTNLLRLAELGEATSATTAQNFTGSLAGDVTGTQSSTTVARIRGVTVSTSAPSLHQVLRYDGSEWVPFTLPGAPVTSVAGRTGDVVLAHTDISGLGTAATLDAGTAASNLVQLDGGAKIPVALLPNSVLLNSSTAGGDISGTFSNLTVDTVGGKTATAVAGAVDTVSAATAANTANTLVQRDGSGDISVQSLQSAAVQTTAASVRTLAVFNANNNKVTVQSPAAFSDYGLTLPVDAGTSGQVLTTDGSGVLTWSSPTGGTVTQVTATTPLSSSGGTTPQISISQANTTTSGYLSSTDWNTFNLKQAALGYTPLDPANNLSELSATASTARTNLGLGSAATLNAGVAASNVVQLDAGAKIPVALLPNSVLLSSSTASGDVSGTFSTLSVDTVGGKAATAVAGAVDTVSAATAANTANTLVQRDGSGDISVQTLQSAAVQTTAASVRTLSVFNANNNSVTLQAPTPFVNYSLTLPTSAGANGQVLTTNGSGVLSWTSPTVGTVTQVTAVAPLASSGGATPEISMAQANTTTSGYLSSTDWNTFNSKQGALGYVPLDPANNLSELTATASTARTNLGLGAAATMNVGTAAGTVSAGNDSRITGALQSSTFNGYVASASCETTETMYWSSVTGTFLCQSIDFPTAPVTTVAGRTGDVTLSNTDISGLGTAATLNAGTAASNLVQLDAGAKIPVALLPNSVLLNSSTAGGDISGTLSNLTVDSVGAKTAAAIATSVDATTAATSDNTVSTLVKRDSSGQVSVTALNASSVASTTVAATNVRALNVNIRGSDDANHIQLRAPAAGTFSDYNLTLPTGAGGNGQVLTTNGSGVLSWTTPTVGTVTQVTAAAPLVSSGGATPEISISQANTTTSGYLSSTDWNTFNSKQSALGYAPLDPANNLSELTATASTARTNLGLGSAATLNAGTAATNLVQLDANSRIPVALLPTAALLTTSNAGGDVSGTFTNLTVNAVGGKTATTLAGTVDTVAAATSDSTASTLVKRDSSGQVTISTLIAPTVNSSNISSLHFNVQDTNGTNRIQVRAPTAGTFEDYNLTLPTSAGGNGQVLTTNGSGVLSWTSPNAGTVTQVTAVAPLASSGGATPELSISQANTTTSGYLSSTDWNTFNSKQAALGYTPLAPANNLSELTATASTARTNLGLGAAATMNVGTAAGTVAAGNDSRITGALQSSTFNAYFASASCTTTETLYWNSLTDTFACQSINFPTAPVTTVAGRTGDVTLSNTDISGLGTAAVLDAGTAASELVQLVAGGRLPASVVQKSELPSYVKKTSGQVFSSTALSDVTGLTVAVTSGSVYKIRYTILYTSADISTGLRLSLVYPSVSAATAVAKIPVEVDGVNATYVGHITSSGNVVASSATPTAGDVYMATVEAVVVPSSNGTVVLRAASAVNSSDITVVVGSFAEVSVLN
ncbi:beta strand repeat-containing protein [Pseudobdellovibrio exovorus]|uniref:Cell wall surface anchor family protein n=1 Tax=Pseudobdellovibrio exovorus JSS TaxID=1184267 RepID=M4VS45_9BACT|nr:hypothetical protein [Pseudobdellovibrio exovorus]AGH96004.1 hypothetical protein A11Q_1788 [Pseudobdellovibrio exovorus JSS]